MMHNPVHPGEILREDVFGELNVSVTDAADHLGISRVQLSRILNKRSAISPELAIRLEKAGVSTARQWLALQANYDLWNARNNERIEVTKFNFPII
tara:strand:- start:774 stop:1061 length:288 start_codon:yes stop_codon:yes gene_type:complete